MTPSPAATAGGIRSPGADRILATARELFAERGVNGVSIQQIADAAGVSKANVFHHFGSKQTLYLAVLQSAAAEFHQMLATLKEQMTTAGLHAFALQHLSALLEDAGVTRLFLRALSEPRASTQRRLAEEVIGDAMSGVVAAVEELRQARVLPADTEAGPLALALVGANLIYFQLHRLLPRLGDQATLLQPAAYTASVVRLLARTGTGTPNYHPEANRP